MNHLDDRHKCLLSTHLHELVLPGHGYQKLCSGGENVRVAQQQDAQLHVLCLRIRMSGLGVRPAVLLRSAWVAHWQGSGLAEGQETKNAVTVEGKAKRTSSDLACTLCKRPGLPCQL